MEENQEPQSNQEIQSEENGIPEQNHVPLAKGTFSRVNKAVEKLNNTLLMQDKKKQKEFLSQSNANAQSIILSLQDKKAIQLRNKQMQIKLDELENQKIIDLEDKDSCALIIHLLQKQIKSQQEIQFLGKFIRLLSVFKENEELLKTSQIFNKIIQNLRCVYIKKSNHLFKYGDRGHEYFILLQGKAYCLIPYSNMIPQEIIKQQTKQKRVHPQVIEDPSDEDFLFENYPKSQCVKIYKPGEAFGEIALLTSENKRMASIVCKEDSWFMSLDKEGFNQIQGSYQQHLLNEKVYFMKQFEIFKPVAVNKILSFLHETHQNTYIMGQNIYTQGEKGEKIFFIMEGEVELIQELTQVGTSKLSNQKYEKYFKNTKLQMIQKQIVLLGTSNYFGDEDIESLDKIHSYSAICRSQTCKVLEVELRILANFLKVYDMLPVFKKAAQNKKSHYQQILQEDIVLNKHKIIEAQQFQKKKQRKFEETIPQTLQPDNLFEEYQLANEYGSLEENKSQGLQEQMNILSPQNTDRNRSEEQQLSNSMPPSSFIPKMNNVYNHDANKNIRQKNYLSVSNVYQSTAKFTLDDVPMTTKMNQDETDQKRIQFRLNKNICKSMENKETTKVHYQKRNLIFSSNLISQVTKSFNGSFDGFPLINQSINSTHNNNNNSNISYANQKTEGCDRKLQIINLNSYDSLKVKEQFEERQRNILFSQQLKQSLMTPQSIKQSIINKISTPKSKFESYLTSLSLIKHSDSAIDMLQKKYSINSPRESSFSIQSSNHILKNTKSVSEYQNNLLQRKRQNTCQIQNMNNSPQEQ